MKYTVCLDHTNKAAEYVCKKCTNLMCKACYKIHPNRFVNCISIKRLTKEEIEMISYDEGEIKI